MVPFNNYEASPGDRVMVLLGRHQGQCGVVLAVVRVGGLVVRVKLRLAGPLQPQHPQVVGAEMVQSVALCVAPQRAVPPPALAELFALLKGVQVGTAGAELCLAGSPNVVADGEVASSLSLLKVFTRCMLPMRQRDRAISLAETAPSPLEKLAYETGADHAVATAAALACNAAYAVRTSPAVSAAFQSFAADCAAFAASPDGTAQSVVHRERKEVALQVLRCGFPVPHATSMVQIAIAGPECRSVAVYEDVGIPARLCLPSRRVLTSESVLTATVRCAHMHGVTLVDVSPIGRWDPELVHVALDADGLHIYTFLVVRYIFREVDEDEGQALALEPGVILPPGMWGESWMDVDELHQLWAAFSARLSPPLDRAWPCVENRARCAWGHGPDRLSIPGGEADQSGNGEV